MRYDRLMLTTLLLMLVLLVVSSSVRKTITGDELAHLGAGYSYLHTGDFRLNHAHPPLLKELAAVPAMPLGGTFDPQNTDFLAAREDRFGQHLAAYFPVAFLIKTPLAILAFLLIALLSLLWPGSRRRLEEAYPLLGAAFFFVPALFSHINIGLRHVLPMMPFLFVFAARVTTIRLRWRGVWRVVLAGLSVWFLWASFSMYPDYLAYFNELIGGPNNGIYYLGDSNIDWGQDLKQLAAYLRSQGTDEVILSYFGDADLTYYGIRYQYAPAYGYQGPLWKWHDYTLSPGAKREFLAISVNNLQGTFFRPQDYDLYRWLYDREPVKRVGYSIYVYDITGDVDAHIQLAGVYSRYAMYDMARLEFEKALQIDPQRTDTRTLLASLPQGASATP